MRLLFYSGDITKLKIDIGEDGKVLVGGLENTALTKKLQKVLNEEEGFAARLNAYQNQEEGLYNALENSMFTYDEDDPVRKTADALQELLDELASYEQRTVRYFPYS